MPGQRHADIPENHPAVANVCFNPVKYAYLSSDAIDFFSPPRQCRA
jgi:hypothetical protein